LCGSRKLQIGVDVKHEYFLLVPSEKQNEVDCKYSESKNTCPLPSKVRSLARHIEPLNRVSSRGKEFTPDISATLFFSASAVQ